MSDQTDNQVANEDTKAAAAASQTKSGDSGHSLAGAALAEALLNDAEAREIARRKLQSEKDKGVARAEKKASEVQDQLEAFANAMGVDLEKVSEYRRNKMLDELYQERYGNSQPTAGEQEEAEAQQPASSLDTDAIKKAFPSLDWNSDAVLKAKTLEEFVQLAAKQAEKPKASATQLPGGGNAVGADANASLKEAYDQEIAEIKLANRGTVPPARLAAVKKKYRDKGFEVW